MLSGDNGILHEATDAKTKTEKANEKEQIQMEVLGSINTNGKLEIATVNSNIKSNISGVTTDEAIEFPLTVTYTTTGNSYSVDEDGKVDKAVIYPLVSNTLKVGDYVEYNNKPYIVLYDMDSEFNWIEIVSKEPLCEVTFGTSDTSEGAQGTYNSQNRAKWSYNNAISKLNTVAQNYLNTDIADRARCIGSVPNNPLSETSMNYSNYKEIDSNYAKDVAALQTRNS